MSSLPMTEPHVITRSGWEFSFRRLVDFDADRYLSDHGYHERIFGFNKGIYHIKHLESGLLFRFSGYDALSNYLVEHDKPYPSRLDDVAVGWGFDSAYIGKIKQEKPDGVSQDICVDWQDIDLDDLYQEILWTDNHRKVSGVPLRGEFPRTDREKLSDPKRRKVQNPADPNLPEAEINFMCPLYLNVAAPAQQGNSTCFLFLTVTHSGWFLYLKHEAENKFKGKRLREMTMHCNFEKNAIYREIIERESTEKDQKVDDLPLRFHEVKRLQLTGLHIGGTSSSDLSPISTLFFEEKKVKDKYFLVSSVVDSRVVLLLANSGEQIRRIEDTTKTKIQISPLFRHPKDYNCNEKIFEGLRKVYAYGGPKVDVDFVNGHLIGIAPGGFVPLV